MNRKAQEFHPGDRVEFVRFLRNSQNPTEANWEKAAKGTVHSINTVGQAWVFPDVGEPTYKTANHIRLI